MPRTIPTAPLLLGVAGLVPPLIGTVLAVTNWDGWGTVANGLTISYAALILSFLGGSWWAFACRQDQPRWGLLVMSVAPSIVAWLLLQTRHGTAGLGLAALILLSPLVDARLARRELTPEWWMTLRFPLSACLATLVALTGAMSK